MVVNNSDNIINKTYKTTTHLKLLNIKADLNIYFYVLKWNGMLYYISCFFFAFFFFLLLSIIDYDTEVWYEYERIRDFISIRLSFVKISSLN